MLHLKCGISRVCGLHFISSTWEIKIRLSLPSSPQDVASTMHRLETSSHLRLPFWNQSHACGSVMCITDKIQGFQLFSRQAFSWILLFPSFPCFPFLLFPSIPSSSLPFSPLPFPSLLLCSVSQHIVHLTNSKYRSICAKPELLGGRRWKGEFRRHFSLCFPMAGTEPVKCLAQTERSTFDLRMGWSAAWSALAHKAAITQVASRGSWSSEIRLG